MPKDVNLKVQQLDDLSDDQLIRKLAVLTEMAKPLLARFPMIDGRRSMCRLLGQMLGQSLRPAGK